MATYCFTLARIVRAGPVTAHTVLNDWAHGQITVPVPTLALKQTSGLPRQELAGAVFGVMANTAAVTDTDVDPHGWRLLALSDGEELAAVRPGRNHLTGGRSRPAVDTRYLSLPCGSRAGEEVPPPHTGFPPAMASNNTAAPETSVPTFGPSHPRHTPHPTVQPTVLPPLGTTPDSE
ncbi:hypothetical protein ACFYWP_33865 [Actinacidiphila glaucinigra]|uniref:hypothetical protein n=1 Tax=Actinacidiphila glaucinigra TaxID=235986 RepID=UPI0036908DC5